MTNHTACKELAILAKIDNLSGNKVARTDVSVYAPM